MDYLVNINLSNREYSSVGVSIFVPNVNSPDEAKEAAVNFLNPEVEFMEDYYNYREVRTSDCDVVELDSIKRVNSWSYIE